MKIHIPDDYLKRPFYKLLYRGLRNETKRALQAAAVRENAQKNKFFIFAQGRTGSTLLTDTLNKHSQIHCDDEILALPRAFPKRHAENCAQYSSKAAYGFHVKIYQLNAWQRVGDVAEFLHSMHVNGWKIIYLDRANYLEHAFSNYFAKVSGKYHFTDKTKKDRPQSIHVEAQTLLELMKEREHYHEVEQAMLEGLPFLHVNYETDLKSSDNQPQTFERIQKYIGVDYEAPEISLSKSVKGPVSDMIENFDEVRAILENTTLERFAKAA